jgi:hypothetical protein
MLPRQGGNENPQLDEYGIQLMIQQNLPIAPGIKT